MAVFLRRKQNLKQICCSVQSDITISREEHDNTWENLQHKPIQPSTAMSAWLLTREGCNYTHLAGEQSTTIRKSSLKPFLFFFGSTLVHDITLKPPVCMYCLFFLPYMKWCWHLFHIVFILKKYFSVSSHPIPLFILYCDPAEYAPLFKSSMILISI